MRWTVFAIFTFLMLVLETGLRALLTIPVGPQDDTAPSFLLVLGIFVSLHAPRRLVPWAMLILGLITDAITTLGVVEPAQSEMLIGPASLGFLLGGFVTIQLRGVVFRESPATLPIVTFAAGIFVHLLIIALVTMRALPFLPSEPVAEWYASDQLARRFLQLLYTTVLAIPLGFVFKRTERLWGFNSEKGNIYGGRASH